MNIVIFVRNWLLTSLGIMIQNVYYIRTADNY